MGATILAVPKHGRESTEQFLAAERPTRVTGRLNCDIASRAMATGEGSAHMTSPPAIGMTDTFGPHSTFDPEPHADVLAKPKSGLGVPILGFERNIIDPETGEEVPAGEEGELLVRGPARCGGSTGVSMTR